MSVCMCMCMCTCCCASGSSRKGVELCTLVVAGGPVTLHTVHFMLRREKPVVVLKGSGGVADLLSYACENIAHVPHAQCVTDLSTNTKRYIQNSARASPLKLRPDSIRSDYSIVQVCALLTRLH